MEPTKPTGCILVVDDDCSTVDLATLRLEAAGYHVVTAENGVKALALARQSQPRIIITDWLMPEMDGLEFCRRIRALQGEVPVYVIMLTIQADKARLVEAFDAGVDDFLSKPFDPGELLARVRAGVRIIEMCDQLCERTQALTRANTELSQLNTRLRELATVDDLTGLFNRRQAMLRLNEHWNVARRYNRALSCAMVDIDHFKAINDRFGHAKGDEVLQKLALSLRWSLRGADLLFRVGGEEFMILFPDQPAGAAAICAERCRLAVATRPAAGEPQVEAVTISIGVAERIPAMYAPEQLLQAADECLYAAKQQGRNRTIVRDAAASSSAWREAVVIPHSIPA